MGLHDPPTGREVNLWNLFSKVKRQDWADMPENLGDQFTKKAHAAYLKATAGLDAEGLEKLRKALTARAKTAAKKELNEATSMARVLKVLKKAVRFYMKNTFVLLITDNYCASMKPWSLIGIHQLMRYRWRFRPVRTVRQGARQPSLLSILSSSTSSAFLSTKQPISLCI